MFDHISKSKLKRIFVFKYIFQLIIVPFIMGLLFLVLALIVEFFMLGIDGVIDIFIKKYHLIGEIYFPVYPLYILFMYLINLLNILSVIPFIKLLVDCISKDDEETKEIEFSNAMPAYELQCIRQSKRFMCDTFSRKENNEVFIYDENKTKYRFYWNEKYGDKKRAEEIVHAKRLKITYFKRSKIIFRCEIIEYGD